MVFLSDEKELAPRTVHNKFAELLTFLAAQGVPKLISKNDRPRFVDQEVEIYENHQLLALHSDCSLYHSTTFGGGKIRAKRGRRRTVRDTVRDCAASADSQTRTDHRATGD